MSATSPLRRCHGSRIAVLMQIGEQERVVEGDATWEEDPALGHVLRIALYDAQGLHALLIQESTWIGEIVDGAAYGCDFCLVPQSACAS